MKQEQPDEALLSQVAQTSDQCHPTLIGMRQGPTLARTCIFCRYATLNACDIKLFPG